MAREPSYLQRYMSVPQLIDPVPAEPRLAESLVPNSEELVYLELADAALRGFKENHTIGSKREVEHRPRARNGVHQSKGPRPLCFEHHIEMEFRHLSLNAGEATKGYGYVCRKRGCSVGYSSREGYFMIVRGKANTPERNMIPCVSCPGDGRLMYLAQVKTDKRSFRLWICPQCNGSRTNREF